MRVKPADIAAATVRLPKDKLLAVKNGDANSCSNDCFEEVLKIMVLVYLS